MFHLLHSVTNKGNTSKISTKNLVALENAGEKHDAVSAPIWREHKAIAMFRNAINSLNLETLVVNNIEYCTTRSPFYVCYTYLQTYFTHYCIIIMLPSLQLEVEEGSHF